MADRELTLSEQHTKKHADNAARQFAGHIITKRGDRRWLLQQMHKDGKPDWTMAAEIIALENSAIYVGGDLYHVIFAHGPRGDSPESVWALLRWMGECTDLGYYVRQKARIGMGGKGDAPVDEWNEKIAKALFAEYLADPEHEGQLKDQVSREYAMRAETQQEFVRHAREALGGGYDANEAVFEMGEVLAPRVICAHAALARLCVLLREEENAKEDAEAAAPKPKQCTREDPCDEHLLYGFGGVATTPEASNG